MSDGINIVHVAHSIADFIKQERVQDAAVIKELRDKLIKGGKVVPPLGHNESVPRYGDQAIIDDLQKSLAEARN